MLNKIYSLSGEKLYGLGLTSVIVCAFGLTMGIMFMVDGSQKEALHTVKTAFEKMEEAIIKPETPVQG